MDTCRDVLVPRLRSVIDGDTRGGLEAHGGGFRFCTLAPSLLERDRWGNWVVSKQYNGPMLAEAMCKLEGFRYAPDPEVFWMHGRSTETDYLYVTDQTLTADQLRFLCDEVGSERTLLVCCRAWRANVADYPNLTLKKIPQAVLTKCEWGRDDYSLNVEELTPETATQASAGADGEAPVPKRKKRPRAVQELSLFPSMGKGGDA